MVIKEFDSTMDGMLNYEEFCSLVLPATNNSLRRICQMRKDSYLYKKD